MNNELRKALQAKGTKCKLQFPASERDYYIRECGFTDEETDVFLLRSRGKTILQISFIMSDKYGTDIPGGQYTVGKVEARIRSIKQKILRVIG